MPVHQRGEESTLLRIRTDGSPTSSLLEDCGTPHQQHSEAPRRRTQQTWFLSSVTKLSSNFLVSSNSINTPATQATTPSSAVDMEHSSLRPSPVVSWQLSALGETSSPLDTITVEESTSTLSETSCLSATSSESSRGTPQLQQHNRSSTSNSQSPPAARSGRTLFPDSPELEDVEYVIGGSDCEHADTSPEMPETYPPLRTESYPPYGHHLPFLSSRRLRSRRSFSSSEHTNTSSRRSSRRASCNATVIADESSWSSSEEHSSGEDMDRSSNTTTTRRRRRPRKPRRASKLSRHYFAWIWMTIGVMSVSFITLMGRHVQTDDEQRLQPRVSILFRQLEEGEDNEQTLLLQSSSPFPSKPAAGGPRPLSGLRGILMHQVVHMPKQRTDAEAGPIPKKLSPLQRANSKLKATTSKVHRTAHKANGEDKKERDHQHHATQGKHRHDAKKTRAEAANDRPERKKVSMEDKGAVAPAAIPVHDKPAASEPRGRVKLPTGDLPDTKRTFELQDTRFYASTTPKQRTSSDRAGHKRVALLESSGFHVTTTTRHRRIQMYPADFTDNTQLYSILDSNDERIQTMERRVPLSDGQCVPMQDWQTTFHPSCNGMHELDMGNMGQDNGDEYHLFGSKGYWRNAWRLDSRGGHSGLDERDTIVLKTLKIDHRFEEAHFEHDRIDAVVMERLTSSPHVINIFGFCGHSVMSEFADGTRLGDLSDKSRKEPLARLRIAADIASGLADVHGIDGDGNATFVHLDINPANVVSVNGMLKLNDFNIGILRRWNTTSNTPCGFPAQYPNPQWRSPEEARNEQHLTEKVDVFSMGHIFFRLICQHEPWNKMEPGGKPSKEEMNEKVSKGVLPFIPEDVTLSTDPEVVAIREAMLSCYTYDPEKRPSARDVANSLRNVLKRLENSSAESL